MKFKFSPRVFLHRNLQWILFLLVANLISIWAQQRYHLTSDFTLAPLFDFDREKNIPTMYSALLMLSGGLWLYFIAWIYQQRDEPYWAWLGLSIIFFFLTIDEFSTLHEELIRPLRMALGVSGIFYYAWVIPYGILLAVFVLAYLRFLYRLPPRTRNLFVISGAIFVAGALGFELISGMYDSLHGDETFAYAMLTTCEELFEMIGMALFNYALLDYVVTHFKFVQVTLKADAPLTKKK